MAADPQQENVRGRRRSLLDLEKTLPVFFSNGSPAVDVFAVVTLFMKLRQEKLPFWTAGPYLVSSLLSFFMHAVGMFMIPCRPCTEPAKRRGAAIACVSTFMRMLGAASLLLLLLDDRFLFRSLALLLPPFVLFIALSVAALCNGTKERVGLNWGPLKQELKVQYALSSNVVALGFGGLSGSVLGYQGVSASSGQEPRRRPNGLRVVAPAFLLFHGVALGLLVVLLCTVPPRIPSRRWRARTAEIFTPVVSYAALSLLFLAIAVAVADIRWTFSWVFFIFFVVVVAVVACLFWRCTGNNGGANDRQTSEQEDDSSKYLLESYFTPLFSLAMSTHSMYSIQGTTSTEPPSFSITCILHCGLCSIFSYAVRSVVFAQNRAPDSAKYCSTFATYATVAATCGFYVSLIWFGL